MACLQRQFHVVAVTAHRPAETLLRLADPVLDRVLVQHQLLGGRLVAAPGLQEDQQGLAQPGVVLVVDGQVRQGTEHPGPQQAGGSEHQGHGSDLTERHRPRYGRSFRERDRLGGKRLLVGDAKPRRVLRGIAEGEVDVPVQVRRDLCRAGECVPDPQRQPRPRARFVVGQEERIARAGRLRCDVADGALQPGHLVRGDRALASPADQADVVLAQPVAKDGLSGGHVDPVALQQLPDPGGPRGVAVPQPVLPFVRIRRDHLFGGLVDVTGDNLGHAQRGGADHLGVIGLLGQLGEQPLGEARVPDPVGAQQRGERCVALSQPARVLDRRGGSFYRGQVDPVLHDLQTCIDIGVDAGSKQAERWLVVAQLRDLPNYHLIDIF